MILAHERPVGFDRSFKRPLFGHDAAWSPSVSSTPRQRLPLHCLAARGIGHCSLRLSAAMSRRGVIWNAGSDGIARRKAPAALPDWECSSAFWLRLQLGKTCCSRWMAADGVSGLLPLKPSRILPLSAGSLLASTGSVSTHAAQ